MNLTHLKHMAIGAGVILAALLLVGLPIGSALTYALLLACPLMMVGMMLMMGGHGSRGGDHSDASSDRGDGPGEPESGQSGRPA